MYSSNEALQALIDGNKRFVGQMPIYPNQTEERRMELIDGQNPFAIILCCSDSRVSPEIIFDRGLGDLFVVRVAGNILDNTVIGSIEYAVDHLQVPLIIVLGHKKCGAIEATVKGGVVHGYIGTIIESIRPAVEMARTQSGDLLDNAIKTNVQIVVRNLNELMGTRVKIIGAMYDLESGKVSFVQQSLRQSDNINNEFEIVETAPKGAKTKIQPETIAGKKSRQIITSQNIAQGIIVSEILKKPEN